MVQIGKFLARDKWSPFLALPNSGSNTCTWWNYSTDTEVGRFYLCPSSSNCDPSRTHIDYYGYVYFANRSHDTVIKLGRSSTRKDIPYNTSTDSTPLPWGTDSRVLREYHLQRNNYASYLPGQTYTRTLGEGLRGVVSDLNGYLWVASYKNPTYVWKINITTDQIVSQTSIGSNLTIYGAVYNHKSNKIFFTPTTSVSIDFLVIDPTTGLFSTKNSGGGGMYGVAIDSDGNMYRPKTTSNRVYKFDKDGNSLDYISVGNNVYSMCVHKNKLYVANASGPQLHVFTCTPFALVQSYTLPFYCHGIGGAGNYLYGMPYSGSPGGAVNATYRIALDDDGFVTGTTRLYPVGTHLHYVYSDFTGAYRYRR